MSFRRTAIFLQWILQTALQLHPRAPLSAHKARAQQRPLQVEAQDQHSRGRDVSLHTPYPSSQTWTCLLPHSWGYSTCCSQSSRQRAGQVSRPASTSKAGKTTWAQARATPQHMRGMIGGPSTLQTLRMVAATLRTRCPSHSTYTWARTLPSKRSCYKLTRLRWSSSP